MNVPRASLPLIVFCSLSALAADRNPAALDALSGGYPRAFFFRRSEGFAANPRTVYEQWDKTFSRLMGIMGKVLDEEIAGRSQRNIEFFTKFKQRHPNQLVMLHYNGNARDPRDQKGRFFAGHWLYYNGAKMLEDVKAEPGETVLKVSDASLFVTGMGRYKKANEDVGLCELDASGKPDWTRSEQVQLVAADAKAGTIRVRRGQFGTSPRAFPAGRAYAAAHVTEGPWGANSNLLWDYNHSTACPRDAAGRTCDDVLIDDLGRHFDGDLAAFDGLEFDVLKYSLPARRGKRGVDTNSDGAADNGVIGGVDRYAEGTLQFCRNLRARLGEKTLILADGWSLANQRAFGVLNGIEAEGWPSLRDYQVEDWSGGLNRQGHWAANSRQPAFNYINHKYNIDGEIVGSTSPKVGYNIHRLVFAGAVFTDSAICYSLDPPAAPGEMYGVWDELRMGVENRLGWLGKPVAPAVHLAAAAPDVLRGLGFERQGDDYALAGLPIDGDAFLTVAMKTAGAPRLFRLRLGEATADASYGWVNDRDYTFTFYIPGLRRRTVRLAIEGAQPLAIAKTTAHAAPDGVYRVFENGIVLANPGPLPYVFDLTKLAPGKRYRRLKGSAEQDPKTNSGEPVAGRVTIAPKDALFLARQ
jgi:hypothetical protein